jgi:nanoRNase/pAp phosphatase (c-di-AMP/oligoRNAs hydrolase)
MTAFVESCVETIAGSASAVAREARGKPRARQMLRALAGKKNILVTAHLHPDPDALASCLALMTLLKLKLPAATVSVSIKGNVGGGLNSTFAKLMALPLVPWDDATLAQYDAVVLVDTQPPFANSPLPGGLSPTAVIDHHRSRGRRPKCAFCDIRPEVGASASIIFSYFMELEAPITPDLGATLLYAIEADLAGAAGTPGELDNVALSSLTLIADTRKLYKMRYVDLPQSYYIAYAHGLANAMVYDQALVSHIDVIDSPEKPAILGDFLLRYDQVQWALVTAIMDTPAGGKALVCSLRTSVAKGSAADMMRRLLRNIGDGGGHRTKAGGYIRLETGSAAEVDRRRDQLRRRFLRALNIKPARAQRLVPTQTLSKPAAAPRIPPGKALALKVEPIKPAPPKAPAGKTAP